MKKPSFFRAIAMYFDIGKAQTYQKKAAISNKWFKIQCLSSEHEDKSMDSANLPKEDRYINMTTNKSGKSMMKCFSCNNNVSWSQYHEMVRTAIKTKQKNDFENLYNLIEKRSNINNPIEFLLKLIKKYNVPDIMIKNFYENKKIKLLINNETISLKPNELLEISEKDFIEIIPILKDSRRKIGEKVFKTEYLYENETIAKKAERVLNNNSKYIEEIDINTLKFIIKNNSKEQEDLKKILAIEEKIGKKIKKEWQEKEQIKLKINEYIVKFYKTNGFTSEYFKKRGIEEEVLKENEVLELQKANTFMLKKELLKKWTKNNLLEAGVLGNFEGKETFIFETHPIIVPLKTATYTRGIQFRCTAKKDSEAPSGTRFKTIGTKNSNYWENNVENYDKVVITEGYSDALSISSILQKIGINNIKVIGVANATNPYNRTLNKKLIGKSIYKLLDNDSAGKSATKKLFNEMINNFPVGTYKFKDISSILKNFKDVNEYFIKTDLNEVKKDFLEILNKNDEKEIEILSDIPEDGEILSDTTIIDIENPKEYMYKETDSKKIIKLNFSQQIELLFDDGLSIENKNYTPDDIIISNNLIYDKELYEGHKLLSEYFKKENINISDFYMLISKNKKLKRMYHDVSDEEFKSIALEYIEINKIEKETDIKDLDIFQYITNLQEPVEYMLNKKIPFTTRGSAGASIIITRQIKMNNNTNAYNPMNHKDYIDFKRFMSVDRKNSLPDIDIDVPSQYRNEIRENCNYYIPKTKSGQTHNSRSYPISIKLRGKELKTKEVPLSDKYLEKFYPSFDILPVNSMTGIEEIYDFTTIKKINKESFFHFADKYLHIKTNEGELAGKIYNLLEKEIKTTDDIISLLALNKTPFNANNFAFIKKYVERLKNRKQNQTNFNFLKNTNGFIVYQEQLLKYLELIGIDGEKRNKIRKLNTKPNKVTDEQKKEIEGLYKDVENAVKNYNASNKKEIEEIFKYQYINLKYNAYIFNFPHALSYHNINMNIYFEEMLNIKKNLKKSEYKKDFSEYKEEYLKIKNEVERKNFLETLQKKYNKLSINDIEGLILLNEDDFKILKEEKEKQQNIKLPDLTEQTKENGNISKTVDKKDNKNIEVVEEKVENNKKFDLFTKAKTIDDGTEYFLMNPKFNKILEKEKSLLHKYKYKIKYYSNTRKYTIWDEKIKNEIEELLIKSIRENERLDILYDSKNTEGEKIYQLNKKLNSEMYKLMKIKKLKDVYWNIAINKWEITSKETKKEVIKIFTEKIKQGSVKLVNETKNKKIKDKKQIIIRKKNNYIEIENLEETTIINFLTQIMKEGNKNIFIKNNKWYIKYIKDENIDEEGLEFNNKLINRIREVYYGKFKIEESEKFTRITGNIDTDIYEWLLKIINDGYEYIKHNKEKKEWLIQTADYNEMGEESLIFNNTIIKRIKDRMNVVEENKILIKEDSNYIKIKGNIPNNIKVLIENKEENGIFYHEEGDFWSIQISKKNGINEEQIEKNRQLISSIKKMIRYEYISNKETKNKKNQQ